MVKRAKKSIIFSALLTIALCVSVMAGGTFALFTSESKTNIAVTSGKVDIVASLSNLKTYSGENLTGDVNTDSVVETATNGTFTNGGTALLDGNTITLDKVTPGDKVTFDIVITNKSNVATKYRTKIEKIADTCLFYGLKFEIDGSSVQNVSAWQDLAATDGKTEVSSFSCSVELPSSASGIYQGKSCTIAYTVEAVQANALTTDQANMIADIKTEYGTDGLKMPDGVEIVDTGDKSGHSQFIVTLNDRESFVYFTQVFNIAEAHTARTTALNEGTVTKYDSESVGNLNMWYYTDRITVKMGCDVDLEYMDISPFTFGSGMAFTFDGDGHTIKNATLTASTGSVGFFEGYMAISNVTLDNITVNATGCNNAGVVAGFTNKAVDNVTVKNSSVTGAKYTGAIVGYDYGDVTNCTIENTVVCGQYKIGGAVGYNCCEYTDTARKITGNTLTNVTVFGENIWPGKESNGFVIGKVVGNWCVKIGVCKDNTFTGTTEATENIGDIEASYVVTFEQ